MNMSQSLPKTHQSNTQADLEKRVAISMAVSSYLREFERYDAASKDFMSACEALQSTLPPSSRFVTQVDFRQFLITSDREGNFDVEQLEVV